MPPKVKVTPPGARPASPDSHGGEAALVQTLLAAEDAENARLARMLHDNVGQHLAALLLAFKSLEEDLKGRPDAKLTLQSLQAITQSVGQELHKVALELRPTALDDYGLIRGLTTFLEEWSLITQLTVELDHHAFGEQRAPPQLERTLFRIIRDALRYILSGEHAERVSIVLKREAQGVTAVIENGGNARPPVACGKVPQETHRANMEARALLVGGTTDVESRPDMITVFVRLPLTAPEAL